MGALADGLQLCPFGGAVLQQLRVILAAEADARAQLDAVRQESARRLQQADDEARRTVRQAQAACEATARAEEDKLIAAAELKARQIASEAHAGIVAQQQRAQPQLERAAALVVGALLGTEATERSAKASSAPPAAVSGAGGRG